MMQSLRVDLVAELAKEGPNFRRVLTQLASVNEGFIQVLDVPAAPGSAALDLAHLDTVLAIAVHSRSSVATVEVEYTNRVASQEFVGTLEIDQEMTGANPQLRGPAGSFAGWVSGNYARIEGATDPNNDGQYIVGRNAGDIVLVLGHDEEIATDQGLDPATVTLHREFRNVSPCGPGQFVFSGLGSLVKEDGITLRAAPDAGVAQTCEVWVYGS